MAEYRKTQQISPGRICCCKPFYRGLSDWGGGGGGLGWRGGGFLVDQKNASRSENIGNIPDPVAHKIAPLLSGMNASVRAEGLSDSRYVPEGKWTLGGGIEI